MNDTNFYHKRGIKIRDCVKVCNDLGLNPACWSHLSTAFEILKAKYALQ